MAVTSCTDPFSSGISSAGAVLKYVTAVCFSYSLEGVYTVTNMAEHWTKKQSEEKGWSYRNSILGEWPIDWATEI